MQWFENEKYSDNSKSFVYDLYRMPDRRNENKSVMKRKNMAIVTLCVV